MHRKFLVFTVFVYSCLALHAPLLRAENKEINDAYSNGVEPKPPEPFPAAFKSYQILPGGFSPDKQYGIIYPKRSRLYQLEDCGLYVAALKPFRIVQKIPLRHGNLAQNANCSYNIHWSGNSAYVVMVEESKWGPSAVYVVQIVNGKAGKMMELTAEVRKQLQPDFKKARPTPYNDSIDYIFDSDGNEVWSADNRGLVTIKCACDSDPNMARDRGWRVNFEGTFDLATGKFIHVKWKRVK